ncbi:MAG: hypothetical protein GX957_00920, partial [Clostridiaceae bacterium]|nr:hypothetical protein [Clostridiaceae bacterium]
MFIRNTYSKENKTLIRVFSFSIFLALLSCTFFIFSWNGHTEAYELNNESKKADSEFIDITANEIIYDSKSQLATAKGDVKILFKTFRVTGDYCEYDENDGFVIVKGKSKFEDLHEGSFFTAEQIMFYLEKEEIEAEGDVSLDYKKGEVLASGNRLSYSDKDRHAILQGNAWVDISGKIF